mgnify:CR=1 FL=1
MYNDNTIIIDKNIKDSIDLGIAPNTFNYPFNEYRKHLQNCLNEYIKIAITLGKDPDKINYLRSQLIKNSRHSNLFNVTKFSNNFVVAIKQMWTSFLKQNKQF